MKECIGRIDLGDGRYFFCENPNVVVANGIVSKPICQQCPLASLTPPSRTRSQHLVNNLIPGPQVAVVIPCHNYGCFVAEAIESALSQTIRPAEIMVVVDSSTDDSAEAANSYASESVSVVSVEFGNVHQVRRFGLQHTKSNTLCFLDADDKLAPDYLETGLQQFTSEDIGIVYSDLTQFGASEGIIGFTDAFSLSALHRENFMHAGSLVRRDVLELSNAFSHELAPNTASCTADWWLWRKAAEAGWKARKQTGTYYYRRHSASALATTARKVSYFQSAWLEQETITLFIPLSGRKSLWEQLCTFLENQTWPHDQIRLFILDTSQDEGFGQTVRHWLASSDYLDTRYVSRTVGTPQLADQPRIEAADEVRRSMAKIYNFLKTELTTELVWILEDDVIPPLDVARSLLEHFDERTVSVAAPYRSRFHSGYVAWDERSVTYREPQEGVTRVGGNGFGCTILRSESLRQTAFSHALRIPDFDGAFYATLQRKGEVCKINWDVECEHLSEDTVTEAEVVS